MTFRIVCQPTPEFEADLAHYGVRPARAERLSEAVRRDPVVGRPHPDDPRLRIWPVEELQLEYLLSVSPEACVILLCRLRPPPVEPPKVDARFLTLMSYLERIARIFGSPRP